MFLYIVPITLLISSHLQTILELESLVECSSFYRINKISELSSSWFKIGKVSLLNVLVYSDHNLAHFIPSPKL
jgi:hypothetical protein